MVDVVTPFFPPADQEKVGGKKGLVSLAHIAASKGENENLKSLLDAGFPIDDRSGGWTLAHCAAAHGRVDTLDLLAARGALLDDYASSTTLFQRGTPLSIASGRGDEAVVKKLLSLRADPNKNNADGEGERGDSPLHSACEFGHVSVVKILLEGGADPHVLDDQKESPLDRAIFACSVRHTVSEEVVFEMQGLLLK